MKSEYWFPLKRLSDQRCSFVECVLFVQHNKLRKFTAINSMCICKGMGGKREWDTLLPCRKCSKDFVTNMNIHDDVIKWKHFPRHWPVVCRTHRLPVNYPLKGQWRGASMFSLICVWINGWVNNREASDLRRHRAHHYGVTLMKVVCWCVVTVTERCDL